MKRLIGGFGIAALLLAGALVAQNRDFLMADEIDQIREAQDPNARIALYAKFARQRVDLVKNLLSKDRSGRSVMIHDALEDYSKILDAVDVVTDQALTHKVDVQTGLNTLAREERGMLQVLRQIRDSKPKDVDRYDFVLKTAIDSTGDSLDLAEEDLGSRTKDVEAREAREKQATREAMTPAEKADQKAGDSEKAAAPTAAAAEQKPAQKKPPTLLRPGEKAGEKKQ